jgi:hypothetical protein
MGREACHDNKKKTLSSVQARGGEMTKVPRASLSQLGAELGIGAALLARWRKHLNMHCNFLLVAKL